MFIEVEDRSDIYYSIKKSHTDCKISEKELHEPLVEMIVPEICIRHLYKTNRGDLYKGSHGVTIYISLSEDSFWIGCVVLERRFGLVRFLFLE